MTTVLDQKDMYPNIHSDFVFRIKVSLLQLKRGIQNLLKPLILHAKADVLVNNQAIASSITPLWNHELNDSKTEAKLQLGKIHNLRIAAQTIHSIEIPKDGIFSFWLYVGQPTKIKGYVEGRELRQGCVIPSIGGGLCQLSNALYSIALDAGFEILERHAHTQIIPGSLAEIGRDATVFWNYVDLRFKVNQTIRLEVSLTSDALIVEVKGNIPISKLQDLGDSLFSSETLRERNVSHRSIIDQNHDCLSCNVSACHRHVAQPELTNFGNTAYLVDEYWIEFDRYIQSQKTDKDLLAMPLNGKRFRKPNYHWSQSGFAQVKTATFLTLVRALATRKHTQGQSLQTTLLKYDQKLAEYFSSPVAKWQFAR
jgi:hypothetical protein